MLATPMLIGFNEVERPLGERLLKLAAEADRVEGYRETHAVELARLAEKLGQRLGLRGLDLSALKFAALAHDLGERALKRDYLLRPGGLTWEEQLDLWRHPVIGEQEAAELKLPRLTQLLIRWHHEWWNGQGYPDGLSGTAIPLGARILRAVDTYCALLADRPYRARLTPAEAAQYIADQAGLETDPQVVKEFLALLEEERLAATPNLSLEPSLTELPLFAAAETAAANESLEAAPFVSATPPTAELPTLEAHAAEATTAPEQPAAPVDNGALGDTDAAELPTALPVEPDWTTAEATETISPTPAQPPFESPGETEQDIFQIVSLSETPDHFWLVAQWIQAQAPAQTDAPPGFSTDQLKEHLAGQTIPATLVAVNHGQPVGSVSLVEQALPGRADLTPCLTWFYVRPEYRHSGVAEQLLEMAYAQAKSLGAKRVYLAVPEQEDLFARQGWQFWEPAVGAQALIVLSRQ